MPEGLGYGIGRGLEEIGQGLNRRFENQAYDREKQADALHEKGVSIASNLLQYAIPNPNPDPTANLVKFGDKYYATEAQPLIDQLKQTSEQVRSLFGPHETPALIQHFRKFLGKGPKPPMPNPRAAQYSPEGFAAEVPKTPNKILQEMADMKGAGLTPEQIMTSIQNKYKTEPQSKPAWTTYSSQDGKTRRVDQNDPEDVKSATSEGFQPYVAGAPKTAVPAQIAAEAKMWAESGVRPPAATMAAVSQYMVENNLTPLASKDNSAEGRMAKALLDSGGAATPEEAKTQAAKMIVDAEKAKEKAAATGATSHFTPEEASALARMDIILGRATAFGLGKSSDRDTYNRAKADLMLGGQLGETLGQKADSTAIQKAMTTMTNMKSSVGAFKKTLDLNLDQVLRKSSQVGRSGSSLANEYMQFLQGKLTDYPELQQFRIAVNTAANEYGRITNSATGGGVSTDTARGEALSLLNTALASGATQGAVQQMRTDADNRIKGMDATITGLNEQIKAVGGTPAGVEELEFGPDGKLRPAKKPPE